MTQYVLVMRILRELESQAKWNRRAQQRRRREFNTQKKQNVVSSSTTTATPTPTPIQPNQHRQHRQHSIPTCLFCSGARSLRCGGGRACPGAGGEKMERFRDPASVVERRIKEKNRPRWSGWRRRRQRESQGTTLTDSQRKDKFIS